MSRTKLVAKKKSHNDLMKELNQALSDNKEIAKFMVQGMMDFTAIRKLCLDQLSCRRLTGWRATVEAIEEIAHPYIDEVEKRKGAENK